jgi:hypothetical protein
MTNNNFFGIGYDESCAKVCAFKPKNILLCHPKSSGTEAIDFGLSCQSSRRRIRSEKCSVLFEGVSIIVIVVLRK